MRICVLIPAGGSSRRYSGDDEALLGPRSKLDEDLGGRPVLQRAVELFIHHPDVARVIVGGPGADEPFEAFRLRHGDRLGLMGADLVRGGRTHRWETVRACLAHVPDDCTHVAVHDAARPVTPPEVIERVFTAGEHHPAVAPALPVGDSLKRIDPDVRISAGADPLDAILGAGGGPRLHAVAGAADRTNLWAVQTPQIFRRDLILEAYQDPDPDATDDLQQAERILAARGEHAVVVQGDPRNVKLTIAADLALVRAIGGFTAPHDRPTHKRF